MKTITCTKLYSDIPFAHRQHNHDGHCRFIHGHGWGFEIVFGCDQVDNCGFVVDFGKLGEVKDALNHLFDHALVLSQQDPLLARRAILEEIAGKLTIVPDCSSEGLADFVADLVEEIVGRMTSGRVYVKSVRCIEDSKNSATWTRE